MLPSRLREAMFRLETDKSLPRQEHHQHFEPKKYAKKPGGVIESERGRKGRIAAKIVTPVRLGGTPSFRPRIRRQGLQAPRRGGKSAG